MEDLISFSWPTTSKLMIICRSMITARQLEGSPWSAASCRRLLTTSEDRGWHHAPNLYIYLSIESRIAQFSCQWNVLHTLTVSFDQLIRCACRSWWKSGVLKHNPAMLMRSKLWACSNRMKLIKHYISCMRLGVDEIVQTGVRILRSGDGISGDYSAYMNVVEIDWLIEGTITRSSLCEVVNLGNVSAMCMWAS